jgi:uncharacterized membrane protein HdeD (DUF308 family)
MAGLTSVQRWKMEARIARFGGGWPWVAAFGVATVLAGIIAVLWPGGTLVVVAIVFAVQLILAGVYRFAFAFTIPGEAGWLRALMALVAILSFILGLYLLGHLSLTLLALAVILGAYWIAQGAVELFVAIGHPELSGRAWTIVSGILSVVAGAVVIVYPFASLYFLTLVLGFWLVIFGATLVARGIAIRSALSHLKPASPQIA